MARQDLYDLYLRKLGEDELKKEKALEAINKSGITNWENTLNYTVEYFIKYIVTLSYKVSLFLYIVEVICGNFFPDTISYLYGI